MTPKSDLRRLSAVDPMELVERYAAAEARIAELEAEVERQHNALVTCVVVSGADVSGGLPTHPPLWIYAVDCVTELRDSYDNAIEVSA